MLQCALVATVTDAYSDFGSAGDAALRMTADRRGVTVSDEDRRRLPGLMRRLPAHADAPGALDLLREAGFRLAALTNSTLETARAQLSYAGLDGYWSRYSPPIPCGGSSGAEPYHAAAALGIEPHSMLMVAAHAWDVAGALRAGCEAAFIARPGQVFDPLVERPAVFAPDLLAAARRIIERES
ncbi:MAG: HAD family hydrolase [Chloroflexia bacterium]